MDCIYTKKNLNSLLNLVFFLVVVSFISPKLIFPQTNNKKIHKPSPKEHHEVKDENYVPMSRDDLGRSPAYKYLYDNVFTVQVNVDANGQNIVGDAANEPSIAVDPTNHNNIVIGWRQFNTVSSNFRQAGYGYSTNHGQTWTFPGVIQPGWFRSDPVLDADVHGNFYYNSLTDNPTFQTKVFKSSNGGASWDNGVYAYGGDKQWMAIDLHNDPGNGNIYSFWTSFYSDCYPGFFTRSTDEGASFQACTSVPNDPSWGTLAVGTGGTLYLAGTDGYSYDFLVAKSTNAPDSNQVVSWSMYTTVSLDGAITYGIGPNPDGLGGQTWIAVDTSGGPYNGYVYLLCSVERFSNSDPVDVMFSRSTNGGVTWSTPVRVNDDPGTSAYQWFGTMSVAPNGRIDVIWLDTRDNPGSYFSSLYYSNSKDGGVTWSTNERLSDSFNPHVGWPQQDKMGDYFTMISDSTGANLAWAATFNNEQDVYYSYITDTTGGTIPVELQAFSASLKANVVTLNWLTSTETNNSGFEIERSSDKSNWRKVGFKEGNGTTTQPQQYSYQDKLTGTAPSWLYYRLKQVDFNGSFKYSNTIEVKIAPAEFSLSQNYPNPFNPSTVIRYQLPVNGNVTLKIYDVLGKEVADLVNGYKQAGKYSVVFNASNLPSGVYIYKLTAGSFTAVKKLMLLK